MSNFSFPPPPPPPPRAAAPSSQQPEPTQSTFRGGRGGRGRGGGGGGGRGNFRGRGGGQNQRGGRPQQQQQQHQNYPSQNHSQYGASVNGTSYGNVPQVPYSNSANHQQPSAIPPGAYVNPAFNPAQVQAESSGAQYGHQSQQQYGQQNRQFGTYQIQSPSQGAQKRTLQQAFGGQSRPHPMKKPPSAPKVQAAPAVPSFGAPLPLPPKPAQPVTAAQPGGKKQNDKKRVSLFGLTPEGSASNAVADEESEEEEEDVDEEANYAANLSTGPLTIEYNGETRNLTSAADIAEWVQERKRFFPTKARIEEKKTEVQMRMEERKRIQQETRAAAAAADPQSLLARSLPGKRERPQDVRNAERQKQQQEQQKQKGRERLSTQDDTRRQLEAKMLEVQELRKRLAESESTAASSAPTAAVSIEHGDRATSIEPETKEVTGTEDVISEASNPAKSSVEALQALEAALDIPPEQQQQQQQKRNPPGTFPENTQTGPESGVETIQASLPIPQSRKSSPSSSSSSSSASDSDSDADSGPEQSSSKPTGPIKVAPPNSDRPICRSFAQHGRCNHANCKFRHVSTEQTRQARNSENFAKPGGRLDRDKQKQPQERSMKTLFQRMVDQERDEENKLALAAIKFLGGVGFLRPQQQQQQQE